MTNINSLIKFLEVKLSSIMDKLTEVDKAFKEYLLEQDVPFEDAENASVKSLIIADFERMKTDYISLKNVLELSERRKKIGLKDKEIQGLLMSLGDVLGHLGEGLFLVGAFDRFPLLYERHFINQGIVMGLRLGYAVSRKGYEDISCVCSHVESSCETYLEFSKKLAEGKNK